MKKYVLFFGVFIILASQVFAYNVPQDSSRAKYFYVFGPDSDKQFGAGDAQVMEIFIDVPQDTKSDLMLAVYDPDTGGFRDLRVGFEKSWDTVTNFAVYGENDKKLDDQTFSEGEYDKKYYQFGPYAKDKGAKVGNVYRFKLVAKATEGSNQNLFSLKVSPDSSEVFAYKVNFRLLESQGAKMTFYPEVLAGVKEISVENYDLDTDLDGGKAELFIPSINTRYSITGSVSDEWAQTSIPLQLSQTERLEYIITKGTQQYANAEIRVMDDKGGPLPIYFRRETPHMDVVAPLKDKVVLGQCNTYTFDATDSYDPNNDEISFLWDLGDGATSEKPVVTHTYQKGGDYTVTLSVKDTSGMKCDTSVVTQNVKVNTAPEAIFTVPENVCLGSDIALDASASKDNTPETLSYRWDLGDGSAAEGKTINKSYLKGGRYNIKLLVDDNTKTACSVSELKRSIAVNTAPSLNDLKDVSQCLNLNEDYKVDLVAEAMDADKDALSYSWDFGDGETGTGKRVSHVYKRGGDYTAKLTVSDGSGLSCSQVTKTAKIVLHKSPIASAGPNVDSCVGTEVPFNGTASMAENTSALSYTWDFGDGSPKQQGAQLSHVYKKGGQYLVTLTTDDGSGSTCSTASDTTMVQVNTEPNALLEKVPAACAGKQVDLDASASNDLDNDSLNYIWDFGDGTIVEGGSKASHSYTKGGRYPVMVTVDDGHIATCGSSCARDSAVMDVVVNTPPIADAGPNLVCCVGMENSFDGTFSVDPDGDNLNYVWDFGDGTTGKGVKTKHVYNKSGSYTVTLTVDDGSGGTCNVSKDTFQVTVNEKPVPKIKIK
ncbi:MAG: PKD domain-containing protein [Candidatus Omnitrophica bacterium]|nr:PKD domain-containing protein [Candidatus Omnitrophota bacterium]